jgi:hypothetical protein
VLITKKPYPRVGEIGKLLGAKWKEMDDEDKKVRWRLTRATCAKLTGVLQPYVDQAAADKIRAEKEKEAFTVSGLVIRSPLDGEPDLSPSAE